MAEPMEITFGIWTWVGPGKHILDGGAHWRHLANTIELYIYGGDCPFCQIALTTCVNVGHWYGDSAGNTIEDNSSVQMH